jgi:hypothetical protein
VTDGITIDGKRIRQTSIEVFHQMEEKLSERRWEAYKILFEYGPMTSNEIFEHARLHGNPNYRHNTNARMTELRDLGVVKEVGKRPCGVTGHVVIEWDVTGELPKQEEKKVSKLFNLSKTDKGDTCAANRCKGTDTTEVPKTLWGDENAQVNLCDRHLNIAIKFMEENPDYDPYAEDEPAPTGDPVSAGMDLVALNLKIEPFKTEGEEIVAFVKGYEIETQEELQLVAEVIAKAKLKLNELEKLEKELTAPLNTVITRVRSLFRPIKQAYKDGEHILKKQIEAVKIKEDANRRKAMQDAAEAHEKGDAPAVVAALSKAVTVGSVRGVTTTSKWKFLIKDETLLPREFLMPNEKLIKEHCAHSTDRKPTPIPGVEFFPDVTVGVTANKVLS